MFIFDLFSVFSMKLRHSIIQWMIILMKLRGWNSPVTLSVLTIYPPILLKVVLYTSMRRSTAHCHMEQTKERSTSFHSNEQSERIYVMKTKLTFD